MKTYKWANNALGWLVFAIAATVYLMTIEPTTSFWDCGEFIVSAFKLEVGHPPGAPFFMLVGNLFTQFASDPSSVALTVNAMSAIFSALTILFLFWTITHLTRRLVVDDKESVMSLSQLIVILGSGAVGALAYTFSDTFWFSAVEGEVYAFSSLLTALVFWLILKWEEVADEPHSDRWIILIAYIMGLSIAVHLLNLLCIPAIVLVYYFKKNPNPNLKGSLIALLVSFAIVAAILYGLVQGLMEISGYFELLFVNQFHLPYNSGVIFYIIMVLGVLTWGIYETMSEKTHPLRIRISFVLAVALLGIPFIGDGIWLGLIIIVGLTAFLFLHKKINWAALNTILICLFVMTIGYSSYALIMIRSAANTPMDQNSPEDIFTLRTYLSREQYGETPLIYGQTFASEIKYKLDNTGTQLTAETKDHGPVYTQIAKRDSAEKDRYFESKRKESYVYVDELNMLFPRMHSQDPRHIQAYKEWSRFEGKKVRVTTPQGTKVAIKPTFAENLRFFFEYQVNFMYWRYFMWNFAGRQNDIQGHGEISNGNWISGIKFLDEKMLGPQDNLPDSIAKNKGHNTYYMLPLLLGILGIFFQIYAGKKGTQQFWITFFLFFMTGLAIVIYLNQTPYQPRERDYAYAGSFYAFCIWIGLGTAAVVKGLHRYIKIPKSIAAVSGTVLALLVPIQMLSQNWDDHNRSGRYLTRDFGYNYLISCEPNSIIFTNGDNDTFPLWYNQEVEGVRTDVRVCNLSYLQTDWYIDQMKREAYESQPLPISWTRYDYIQGKHDIAYIYPRVKDSLSVTEVLDWVKNEDPRTKRIPGYAQEIDNIITDKILIPVDTSAVLASGLVKPEQENWLHNHILINLGEIKDQHGEVEEPAKRYLAKNELMILNMLENNADWKRPMYYALTVSNDQYLRLEPYFRQEGIVYRIMPFQTNSQRIDSDVMYDNLMNKYRWGNLEQEGLYLDENSIRMSKTFRILFGMLSRELANAGDTIRCKEVLDKALQVIPNYNVPYDYYSTSEIAESYSKIGEHEKAEELYIELAEKSLRTLNWYSRLSYQHYASVMEDARREFYYMQNILLFFQDTNEELFEKYSLEYYAYYQRYGEFTEALRKRHALNR